MATFPHPIKGRVNLNIRIPLQGEQVLILLTIALYLMANHQALVYFQSTSHEFDYGQKVYKYKSLDERLLNNTILKLRMTARSKTVSQADMPKVGPQNPCPSMKRK